VRRGESSINLVNEEALVHWVVSRQKQIAQYFTLCLSSQRRASPKRVAVGAYRKPWVITRTNDVDVCGIDTADGVW
jgi:hypothetical protein